MATKKDLLVMYGDGQTHEIQVDPIKYPIGSKERQGHIDDAFAEWDYWNERTYKRNKEMKRLVDG